MSKKIEISGNFLRITDTITNFVEYDRGARLSEVRIYENDNTFYIYYGENYAKQYDFNELVDVNGNPFANINDFIAWKDINTGFKTASGGSGAIANSTNVGLFRYYVSGGFSFLECCMQTGTATYEWILISQQEIL